MCNFPARQLLEYVHKVASEIDPSGDPAKLTYACGVIKAAGELRLFHEDLTECQCWYEALRELGWADDVPALMEEHDAQPR